MSNEKSNLPIDQNLDQAEVRLVQITGRCFIELLKMAEEHDLMVSATVFASAATLLSMLGISEERINRGIEAIMRKEEDET